MEINASVPDKLPEDTRPPNTGLVRGQRVTEAKVAAVRRLRQEMTPEESLLWARLRGHRLHGIEFRRQHLLHGFIVDFYCHAAGVVVEVDGPIHAEQTDHDRERDSILESLGLTVIRVTNDDIRLALSDVLERIATTCMDAVPISDEGLLTSVGHTRGNARATRVVRRS